MPTKAYPFKASYCMAFSIFTDLCSYHHYLVPGYFHNPKRNPYLLAITFLFLLSSTWKLLIYLLSFWKLPILNILHNWNFMWCIIFSFFHLTWCFQGFTHVALLPCMFFLWQNTISLYEHRMHYLFIKQLMEILNVYVLLWLMLIWMFMYRFLCGQSFHFSRLST